MRKGSPGEYSAICREKESKRFDQIFVCLNGSPLAEKILPLAQGIASAKGFTVILLRVVGDSEELSAEESYMRERVGVFRAPMRFLISPDPAAAIIGEWRKILRRRRL
jgi:hypothetical protein